MMFLMFLVLIISSMLHLLFGSFDCSENQWKEENVRGQTCTQNISNMLRTDSTVDADITVKL